MVEQGRLLLGAFERADDAVATTTRVVSTEPEVIRAGWPRAHEAFLAERRDGGETLPSDLPPEMLRLAAERMDVALFRTSLRDRRWRLAMVPLSALITPQPIVNLARVEAMALKLAAEGIVETMFPTQTDMDVAADASAGPAVTLVSKRGELVVSRVDVRREEVSGAIEIVFRVEPRPNYVSVLRCGSRLIVRNGNHRIAAAWRRGLRELPCVLVEGDAAELVGDRSDRFPLTSLMSERPPRMVSLAAGSDASIEVLLRMRRTSTRVGAEQSSTYD
jgi:hypothetical protein